MEDVRLSDLRASWYRSLTAANKAKGTRTVYMRALDQFTAHSGDPEIHAVTKKHVERFIGDQLDRLKPATVSIDYRALQQFFKWAVAENEIDHHPMTGMKSPHVPVNPVPIIQNRELERLIEACKGPTFEDRRDLAIVRLFWSSGTRLSELTRLSRDDVHTDDRMAQVLGKGRRYRTIKFDLDAANAIDRYLRIRRRHRLADLPELWIGDNGPLTPNGLYQAIRRRARSAGITVHPHQFRHTFAHTYLENGGNEGDLQQLAGWKSRQMLSRYAASTANARAIASYDKVMLRKKN